MKAMICCRHWELTKASQAEQVESNDLGVILYLRPSGFARGPLMGAVRSIEWTLAAAVANCPQLAQGKIAGLD